MTTTPELDVNELERLLAAVSVRPIVETDYGPFDVSDENLPLDFSNDDWARITVALDAHHKAVAEYTHAAANALPGLIQRLREAEYDRDVIAPANTADVDALHQANAGLQARIARLERVREAAEELVDEYDTKEGRGLLLPDLRAALAAVDDDR